VPFVTCEATGKYLWYIIQSLCIRWECAMCIQQNRLLSVLLPVLKALRTPNNFFANRDRLQDGKAWRARNWRAEL
jgi:hypothetical protein